MTQAERAGTRLALEPGGYPWTGAAPFDLPALPIVTDLPPIMILADHVGYPDGVRHGVTTYLVHVLPLLAAAGVNMTVCFLRGPHAAADDLEAQGIHPVFFDAGKWDPTVALRVAALAQRNGVHLLHATGVKGTLAARVAGRLTGVRTLLHVHDLNDPGAALSALQRLAARPTDAAVCVSEAVRELAVTRYHVQPERVRVARNGLPLAAVRRAGAGERSRVRSELGIEAGRPVLAIIGRMHPVKGHRTLLEMLPAIVRCCPRALLLVIGDGPERAPCEELARGLGMSRHVRFLGRRSDVPRLLAAIDLVLMPSQSEGLGLAAIEALAAARPVIAFAVGGLPEVVADGQNGRLVPPGDGEAFANAIVETLRDPGRRFSYARGAASSADRFGLEAHVQRLIDCYRMTLAP
ncbi:MAG TPA: glycosyltransferase family 4 protein [Steroidobacteraceae bacterium]|nr:glycosyltransferase family 4 protein [Steroidobacteraceae bacterium]